MQKRTHKLSAMGDAAAVIASSATLSAAAKKLGVNRSTLHRWIEAGKVPRPGSARAATAKAPAEGQSPAEWAADVRKDNPDLTGTELQLLTLAVEALTLARDLTANAQMRIAAMGRYQQLVKQLQLEPVADEGAALRPAQGGQRPNVVAVRKTGTDPRAILMAVK